MKFSENWLRAMVPIEADRAELVERLTLAGLEVESVEVIGDNLDDVVVAEIIEVVEHPSAERLRICRVDAGDATPLQIVCGAPNARAGLRVPLARVGARLPGGAEIRSATLRGVESSGMLCSAKELGIDADAGGLLELASDARPGTSIAAALALPDAVIEIKLTPNRADCLGMEGLAAEVGALSGIAWTPEPVNAPPQASTSTVRVKLNAADACPRYLSRVIEGVDPGVATPPWMRSRLVRGGVRPVNAIVDVGNYVMLETGQPTHVFDRGCVGPELEVRWATDGERLELLDGSEVGIQADTLVIADARGPLALAGVMGGMPSRVTDSTRDLLLEAAHFAPSAIAGRARKYGRTSEAAHRFERGVDPELPRRAIERLTELLMGICGGRAGPVVEAAFNPVRAERPPIRLRAARIARVLGIPTSPAVVERTLAGLGMRLDRDGQDWRVTPPTRRFDLAIEEDLIEEVARVIGYDAIPARVPEGAISAPSLTEGRIGIAAFANALRHRGYSEAVNFSFVDSALLERWGLAQNAVALANPLSSDLSAMRTALLPGLAQALARNHSRQQSRVRLFEIGRVFTASGSGAAPVESLHIAGCAVGPANPEQWGTDTRPMDFHDLKGDIEQFLALAGDRGPMFEVSAESVHWLHPGRSAALKLHGATTGWFGALAPSLQRMLDIDNEVHAFEFELDPLRDRHIPRASDPSRFPSVRRDLALIVPEGTPFAAIEACVRAAAGPQLREIVLFDRFIGKDLPAGCKSVAIGLILQDHSRTLAEEDVSRAVTSVVGAVERGLGARLR